jgi:hypothetical protein
MSPRRSKRLYGIDAIPVRRRARTVLGGARVRAGELDLPPRVFVRALTRACGSSRTCALPPLGNGLVHRAERVLELRVRESKLPAGAADCGDDGVAAARAV